MNYLRKFLFVFTYFIIIFGDKFVHSSHVQIIPSNSENNEIPTKIQRKESHESINLEKPKDQLFIDYVQISTLDPTNESNVMENDSTQYRVEEYPKSFYMRFNHDSKAVSLKYQGEKVWEHDSNSFVNEYPKDIFFSKDQKKILINYPTLTLIYEYSNSIWTLKSKTELKQVFSSNLTIVTTDDEKGTNPKENDTSKFNVKRYDYVVHYEMNENTFCTEFRCNNKCVWNFPKNPGRGFPKSIYLHTDLSLIFVDYKDSSTIYRCNKEGCKLIASKDMSGLSESDIKIFTQHPSDSTKSLENDESQYKKKALGYAYLYNFNEGSKCNELKFGNRTLWNYGYKSGVEYPKSIFVTFYFRMIVIKFSDFHLVYMYLDRWRFVYKSSVESFSDSDAEIVTLDNNDPNKTNKNDPNMYDLIKYPYGYAFLYDMKEGTKCTEIKFKGKSIWKHDPSKFGQMYPNNIYFNRDMKMAIVISPKYYFAYVKLAGWKEVFRSIDKDILSVTSGSTTPGEETPESLVRSTEVIEFTDEETSTEGSDSEGLPDEHASETYGEAKFTPPIPRKYSKKFQQPKRRIPTHTKVEEESSDEEIITSGPSKPSDTSPQKSPEQVVVKQDMALQTERQSCTKETIGYAFLMLFLLSLLTSLIVLLVIFTARWFTRLFTKNSKNQHVMVPPQANMV